MRRQTAALAALVGRLAVAVDGGAAGSLQAEL